MAKVELNGDLVGSFTCNIFDNEDIDEAVAYIMDEVGHGVLELTDEERARVARYVIDHIDPYDLADITTDAVSDVVGFHMAEAVRRIAAEKGYE